MTTKRVGMRKRYRPKVAYQDPGVNWHTCQCGKRAYKSRRDARIVRKQLDGSIGVYRCREAPDLWHIGHTPRVLAQGVIERDSVGRTR